MNIGKRSALVKKKYELVPPDGGWAYMIWISMMINLTVITSFAPCHGMIFNDFFTELKMGTVDILVLNGVNAMCIAISGFLTGPLSKFLSMRKLAFLSSTLLNAGVFATVFVNTHIQLIVCQGLLQNVGVGMLYNVACTSGNDYFLKKRFLFMNLAQTISAVAAITIPWLVHWAAEKYGYRGTLILVSAVSLQSFVASALLQPVKWHLKKIYVSPDSIELLAVTKHSNVVVRPALDLEKSKLESSSNTLACVDINIDSLATNCKGNTVLLNIKKFFDWPFLKKFVLLRPCTCIGIPLSLNSDVIFTILVPQALYALKWTKVEVALALSLLAFGDIATKIFLTIGSVWLKKVGNHLIYTIGMALEVIAKLALMWSSNTIIAYISLTLIGCSRSILIALFPLVISDVVAPSQYARGLGLTILFYGLIALTLGPAIGAVREATDDYKMMFYVLNFIMAVVTIAWSIELFYNRKQKTVVV